MVRFCIVILIAVLAAAFGAGYLGLGLVSTTVICVAAAIVTALVQMAWFSAGAITEGHDPFGGEERET